MKRYMPWLVLAGALGLAFWLWPDHLYMLGALPVGYEPHGDPETHGLTRIERDERPAFRIDRTQPWQLQLGRGSGWHGLETIKLDQEGRMVLHRFARQRKFPFGRNTWETSATKLPREAVTQVLAAVEANRLLELERGYYVGVRDGTQWVLWIRQGDREKSVYFDNHFPDPIVQFARQLDEIITDTVGAGLKWRPILLSKSRDHEGELWDSIKR